MSSDSINSVLNSLSAKLALQLVATVIVICSCMRDRDNTNRHTKDIIKLMALVMFSGHVATAPELCAKPKSLFWFYVGGLIIVSLLCIH